ncbi:hypothetical protein ACVIGA_005863 [Bradyrhizobium sp. USDA 3240]
MPQSVAVKVPAQGSFTCMVNAIIDRLPNEIVDQLRHLNS